MQEIVISDIQIFKIFRGRIPPDPPTSGIEFRTPCFGAAFGRFEKNNDGISLLVFGREKVENKVYIISLYVPTARREKIVRLFFYKGDSNESHYCVVSKTSALVSRQVTGKKDVKYVCDYCLNYF